MVRAALIHEGPARLLVHRLKYEGVEAVADLLAVLMLDAMPETVSNRSVLIPVPRVLARRVRHGVDTAHSIASALSRACGAPVLRALRAPAWSAPHAGRDRRARRMPVFTRRCGVPPGAVLVDDVVTTGSTLDAAAATLDGVVASAMCATSAPQPSQVSVRHNRSLRND